MPEQELPTDVPTAYTCPVCGIGTILFTEDIDYVFNGDDDVKVGVHTWACNNDDCGEFWYNEEGPAKDWNPPVVQSL